MIWDTCDHHQAALSPSRDGEDTMQHYYSGKDPAGGSLGWNIRHFYRDLKKFLIVNCAHLGVEIMHV